MRIKIYLDGKMKADLPGDITLEKLLPIFKIYYYENWKHYEIKKEEEKK